jgi:mannose-6-phosphate isomerase-like protein (cupin superfamily)
VKAVVVKPGEGHCFGNIEFNLAIITIQSPAHVRE